MPYNAIYLREGLRTLLDVVDDHIAESPTEGLGLIDYRTFSKAINLPGRDYVTYLFDGISAIGEQTLDKPDAIADAFYAEMEKPVNPSTPPYTGWVVLDPRKEYFLQQPLDTKPVLRSIATTSVSPVKADEITERSNLPSHYELPPNPITGIGQIADIARQLSQLCTDMERETNKGCL